MGKGAVSDDDPRSLMTIESGDGDEATAAAARADLVIAAGYDVAEHDPADWNRTNGTPVVHVDSESAEVYDAYDPAVEIVADVGATLSALAERVPDAGFDAEWFADYRERIVASASPDPEPEASFSVRGVLPLLREAMAPEDVLVSDVGNHKQAIARYFPTYEPNTCVISNGLASMGIAVPGALAADLAVDANVVAATGDGGFLMNAAELETATRLDCGFAVVVFADGEYGSIERQQREHGGETYGTRFTNPDLTAFAESFGIEGYRPETADDLVEALDGAVEGGMALVEVPIA